MENIQVEVTEEQIRAGIEKCITEALKSTYSNPVNDAVSKALKEKEGVIKVFVDDMGERFAKQMGYPVLSFPADWRKYGLSAGPIRNRQMGEVGTHCVVYSSGGRGSESMISIAKEKKIPLRVVNVKKIT